MKEKYWQDLRKERVSMVLRFILTTLVFAYLQVSELRATNFGFKRDEQDRQISSIKPNFIVNTIVHVPSSFKPLGDIDKYKNDLDRIPYFIEKDTNTKGPRRGKLWKLTTTPNPNENAYRVSSILGPFFDRIAKESFAESALASLGMTPSRVSVAAFLNRMRSVCESTNQEFFNCIDDLAGTIEHKFIMSLWEPQWIKKEITDSGETRYVSANFAEIVAYYENLKRSNSALAHAFLQVNEYQHLNSIVPYRELRDVLLKDEATKSLVRRFRAKNLITPVYVAFMDADVLSFRTEKKGVFSYYEEAIASSSEILHGLTTGYSVSVNQDPFASLAVSFDLGVRRALSTIFSLAPYYPEPNAVIRVLDGHDTLEVSFPGISTTNHAKYTNPQEVPLLIREVVRSRFNNSNGQASPHFKFLSEGAIETKLPPRFLQNRKKKDGTKKVKVFSGQFSHEINQFTDLTQQDLTYVRNTSQSHLKTRDWSGYIYHYLEEHMRLGSIRVVNVNQPGAIVKNRKDLFLISMFSSIHSAYSPIAIALKNVETHGYNLIEYLFSLVRGYTSMTPAPLHITYGDSKSTKPTGDLLKKHISTYEGLFNVIDTFYNNPVAVLVTQASRVCGMSELPVIMRYVQCTYMPMVPRAVLTVQATQNPQKIQNVITNTKNKAALEEPRILQERQQVATIVYPSVALSLANIKVLLGHLYRKVSCSAIDRYVGITEGNSGRIIRGSKALSPNVRTIWAKFSASNWDQVFTGLHISIQDLAAVLNADIHDVQQAKERNSNFLDAFFRLVK